MDRWIKWKLRGIVLPYPFYMNFMITKASTRENRRNAFNNDIIYEAIWITLHAQQSERRHSWKALHIRIVLKPKLCKFHAHRKTIQNILNEIKITEEPFPRTMQAPSAPSSSKQLFEIKSLQIIFLVWIAVKNQLN